MANAPWTIRLAWRSVEYAAAIAAKWPSSVVSATCGLHGYVLHGCSWCWGIGSRWLGKAPRCPRARSSGRRHRRERSRREAVMSPSASRSRASSTISSYCSSVDAEEPDHRAERLELLLADALAHGGGQSRRVLGQRSRPRDRRSATTRSPRRSGSARPTVLAGSGVADRRARRGRLGGRAGSPRRRARPRGRRAHAHLILDCRPAGDRREGDRVVDVLLDVPLAQPRRIASASAFRASLALLERLPRAELVSAALALDLGGVVHDDRAVREPFAPRAAAHLRLIRRRRTDQGAVRGLEPRDAPRRRPWSPSPRARAWCRADAGARRGRSSRADRTDRPPS